MPGSLDASGRQKVALARAIVRKARAYLLDEPLTNLDPKGRVEMKLLIKKLSAEIGQTIVYVTHDQSEAMTLADKIAVMKDGELKQYDSPENIYLKPSDTFVAWFIGNPGMNFIETTLKEDGERVYLDAGPFKYDVTYMKDAIKEIPVEAIMGIRPEHIEVSREKLGNYWLEGTCTLIEPLGGRQLLHIDVGGIELKAKISPFTSVASGEKIWVLFPQQFIRIFDKKNKKLMWP
jgi:multiple sugar transport system ATP-binding protein